MVYDADTLNNLLNAGALLLTLAAPPVLTRALRREVPPIVRDELKRLGVKTNKKPDDDDGNIIDFGGAA